MTNDYMSKYNTYLIELRNKGIDPKIISCAKIIKSASITNNEYDFDTDNIISGPYGELVKINYETNDIEIYDREDNYVSMRMIDLTNGELKEEQIDETNFLQDIDFFGAYLYNRVLDNEEKDYSKVRREVFKDTVKSDIRRLEEKNNSIRENLPELKKDLSRYLSDFYAHDAIRKIIDKIDESYEYKNNYKLFESEELSGDMLWLINNKLRLDFLKRENESFNNITIFPLVDLIEDYSKYNRKEENKVVVRCTKIMNSVYKSLNEFYLNRTSIKNKNYYTESDLIAPKRHMKLFLRRAKEIQKENDDEKY